ncbi:hypothetical protein [Lysobacter soli]|uniref:Uncharacterized protein n=1 Tax=Lysobacter soli TaxID=453783 RepID=A0A3D8VD58_9GAMM|nr:hypothetical protein [Lysobacter soli]RDY67199.1 hypothetical protein DX912_11095 [Lysobacter soli]
MNVSGLPWRPAVISLQRIDSYGRPGRLLPVATTRPAARAESGVWYGFAIAADLDTIGVGESVGVHVSFLDEEGARQAFESGTPIPFGDGVILRGTLVLTPQEETTFVSADRNPD